MQSPVHIFIVENSGIFTRLLEYVFTKETRFRFIHFTNGEDCVNNLHLEPDIILLKENLPDMKGTEVLRKIKKTDSKINVLMILDDEEQNDKAESLFRTIL